MYGESLTENCLACLRSMTIKQYGIQEQLIDYNLHQFYVTSLFNYLPFNSFIAKGNENSLICVY